MNLKGFMVQEFSVLEDWRDDLKPKKLEDLIVMLLLSTSNIVEIESTYDEEEEGKDMFEASSAFSNSEVESDDLGSICSTLSKDKSCLFVVYEEELS